MRAALRDYLAGVPDLKALFGARAGRLVDQPRSATAISIWSSSSRAQAAGVAVKQALPYVRLVGESWPLPLSRAHYEYLSLSKQAQLAPGLVPALLHHTTMRWR